MKEEQKRDEFKLDPKKLKNAQEQIGLKFTKINSEEFMSKKEKAYHERPPSEMGKVPKEDKLKPKTKTKKASVKKST